MSGIGKPLMGRDEGGRPRLLGRNRAERTSQVPPLPSYRSTIAKDPSAASQSETLHAPFDTSGSKAITAAQG